MTSHQNLPASCDDLRDMITAYCDDELTAADCEQLKEHIAGCDTCSSEYQSGVMLKSLVRRSCQCESAPDYLRVQILTRISTTVRDA